MPNPLQAAIQQSEAVLAGYRALLEQAPTEAQKILLQRLITNKEEAIQIMRDIAQGKTALFQEGGNKNHG
jgi:hypothetical protein